MNAFPSQAGADNNPRPTLPAWASPGPLMANAGVRSNRVTVPGATATLLARADPKRIAIGFGPDTNVVDDYRAGPVPDPAVDGFRINGQADNSWFDLLRFGPAVNLAWNGSSTAGGTIMVYEVYLLG